MKKCKKILKTLILKRLNQYNKVYMLLPNLSKMLVNKIKLYLNKSNKLKKI